MNEEVENAEVVNGLPGSWDSFQKEVITFSGLWKEHTQEED